MKYKVGDRIRIKSKFYFCNVDEFNNINMKDEFFNQHSRLPYCETVMTIGIVREEYYILKEDRWAYKWTDEMIEGLAEENDGCSKCGLTPNSVRCLLMDNCPYNKQKTIIEIPEGYVLKDENGKEILTSKIILEKKKPKYPKTYEECINKLDTHKVVAACAWEKEMKALQTLLVCRDAYWKIAGEEMGLGKSWEPEYKSLMDNHFYVIYTFNGVVEKRSTSHRNAILPFPTEEMRDAFYETFKELIEECKELL